MRGNGVERSAEWKDFEADAAKRRLRLERTLRRELVHDPRAAAVRLQNLAVADIADEAFTWAIENWKAKPTSTSPETWTRKHALHLLDEAMDREALAAESRADERDAERRLSTRQLTTDDEERAGWAEIADLATRKRRHDKDLGEDDPFDALASDPMVSSPADRLDERETFVEVEKALLLLPELRRRAVAHRYLDGLAVDDIAYLLDAPADTVRREIAYGLEALHFALAARS